MRTIERSSRFKRDFRLITRQIGRQRLDAMMVEALGYLLNDRPLPASFRDHGLTNSTVRDCHLRPDLILLYEKVGGDVLRLIRIGSHSDLF